MIPSKVLDFNTRDCRKDQIQGVFCFITYIISRRYDGYIPQVELDCGWLAKFDVHSPLLGEDTSNIRPRYNMFYTYPFSILFGTNAIFNLSYSFVRSIQYGLDKSIPPPRGRPQPFGYCKFFEPGFHFQESHSTLSPNPCIQMLFTISFDGNRGVLSSHDENDYYWVNKFANLCTIDLILSCHIPKERNCNIEFPFSSLIDSSILYVCSYFPYIP